MLGSIPASIALVAPVGRKDLAEKPRPLKPAFEIEHSRTLATDEAEMALKGFFKLINTAPSERKGSDLLK